MGDLSATNIVYMAIFTIFLVSLAIWAQSFRRQPKDIIGNSKYFLGFSGVLILICIGSMVFKGFNKGMDFTGGTVIEVGFYEHLETLTTQQIASAILKVNPGLKEPQVQLEERVVQGAIEKLPESVPSAPASGSPAASTPASPASSPAAAVSPSPAASPSVAASPAPSHQAAPSRRYKRAIIRLGKQNYEMLSTEEIETLLKGVEKELGEVTLPPLSTESISPIIGSELFGAGIKALLIALVLQLIYITFRFGNQVRYGISADVALVHDVIVMSGIYSLSGRQVDSPFLAALLTVIGYSVMDSIVIFDRIRENTRVVRKGDFESIVNKSVNETMTRSINTLMTVLLCLFALYFFGGSTLKNFAFALLVGVTSGAYSSIFVASPVLVWWDKVSKQKEGQRVAQRRAALEATPKASPKAIEPRSARKPGDGDENYPSLEDVPAGSASSERNGAARAARARRKGSGRRRRG